MGEDGASDAGADDDDVIVVLLLRQEYSGRLICSVHERRVTRRPEVSETEDKACLPSLMTLAGDLGQNGGWRSSANSQARRWAGSCARMPVGRHYSCRHTVWHLAGGASFPFVCRWFLPSNERDVDDPSQERARAKTFRACVIK
jgi:hypothetical protein